MKKVLFLGVFAMLGLASCKKVYTCECSPTLVGNLFGLTATSTTTINAKKKDAKKICESSSVSADGITSVACKLK
jgi:hypothetical protein